MYIILFIIYIILLKIALKIYFEILIESCKGNATVTNIDMHSMETNIHADNIHLDIVCIMYILQIY